MIVRISGTLGLAQWMQIDPRGLRQPALSHRGTEPGGQALPLVRGCPSAPSLKDHE